MTVEERFWSKVNRHGPRAGRLGFCWEWTASVDGNGYGKFRLNGRLIKAHNFLISAPAGLEPDHRCRNRRCVRPSHIEFVTHAENLRRGQGFGNHQKRKTRCPQGHKYTAKNTWVSKQNKRHCRTCNRDRKTLQRTRG